MSPLACRLRTAVPFLLLVLAACGGGRGTVEHTENRWAVSGMRCLVALAEAGGVAAPWTAPRRGSCGVDTPVSLIAAVAGFDPPLGTSCAMALAWTRFTPELQRLARHHLGTTVAMVRHYGSYACRRMTGNGRRMSLHASARAVDIAGFVLADGTEVRVGRDWRGRGARSRFLLALARAACGHFGVVLTPDHDRDHRDHIHLDIGPWRLCGL